MYTTKRVFDTNKLYEGFIMTVCEMEENPFDKSIVEGTTENVLITEVSDDYLRVVNSDIVEYEIYINQVYTDGMEVDKLPSNTMYKIIGVRGFVEGELL